jgi:hypothetical protein
MAFLALLGEVLALLDASTPPEPGEDCGLCNYRKEHGELQHDILD